MEKTFREVIETIKEGEVWESCVNDNLKTIYLEDGYIVLDFSNGGAHYFVNVRDDESQAKYTLRRNKYTFLEAFEAYEEGKEIISLLDNICYKKIKNEGKCKMYNDPMYITEADTFLIDEIRGEWYIEGK